MDYNLDVCINADLPIESHDRRVESFKKTFESRLKKWRAKGLLLPDAIMERLTLKAQTRMWEDDFPFLQSQFTTYCSRSTVEHLKEPAFTLWLANLFPVPFHSVKEAGFILFASITYLAAIPFPINPLPVLTLGGLSRAVALLVETRNPLCQGVYVGAWMVSRQRTRRDQRRTVFQSLASQTRDSGVENAEVWRKPSLIDDLEEDLLHDAGFYSDMFIDVSAEDPEMTDLLDTLTTTQPDQEPGLMMTARAAFHQIAITLPRSHAKMDNLRIPQADLLVVLKLLLTIRLDGPGPAAEQYVGKIAELESVASCLLTAFVEVGDGGISWGCFDWVIAKSMPYLLHNLSNLFKCFFKLPAEISAPREPLLPTPGYILTSPVLSQISFFVAQSLEFNDLRLLYTANASASIGALKDSMQSWKGPSMLLVSGRKGCIPENQHAILVKERLIYGAFLPVPWDGTQDADFGSHDSLLFQLYPIHEVFRARKQMSQYVKFPATGGLLFGGTQGVRLSLDEALKEGVFTHEISDEGSYENSFGVRQNLQWEEVFRIEALERWGFGGEWFRYDLPFM